MKNLKKRKLAFATAIATLTASLSMFSSVSASASHLREYVVLSADASKGVAMVIDTEELPAFYGRDYEFPERVFCCSLLMLHSDFPLFAQVIEQVKYGDIIRFSGEGDIGQTEKAGVNNVVYDYNSEDDENTFEIVGSIFDTPSENFGSVTIDDETFMQVILDDGTRFIVEDGITYDDADKMLYQRSFPYKRGHCPVWVLPNEDGDVNSDNQVNSADAAVLLEEIALNAVGDTGKMNASENKAADVNGDGVIDAQDAAVVLSYTSEVGSGMLEGVTLKAYAAQ